MGLSAAIMLLTICAAPVAAWFIKSRAWLHYDGFAIAVLITGLTIQHEALSDSTDAVRRYCRHRNFRMAIGLAAAIVAALYGARYWALVVNQLVLAPRRRLELVGLVDGDPACPRVEPMCDRCFPTAAISPASTHELLCTQSGQPPAW